MYGACSSGGGSRRDRTEDEGQMGISLEIWRLWVKGFSFSRLALEGRTAQLLK